jgi:hypothetical protein
MSSPPRGLEQVRRPRAASEEGSLKGKCRSADAKTKRCEKRKEKKKAARRNKRLNVRESCRGNDTIKHCSESTVVHKLKILLVNARSIRRKWGYLEGLCTSHSPDVVAITESWLDESDLDQSVKLSGFKLLARKDRLSKTVGGVLLLLKDSLSGYPLQTNSDAEVVWAMVSGVSGDILLAAVYRPPGSTKEECHIRDVLPNLIGHENLVGTVITGDFNAHHHDSL